MTKPVPHRIEIQRTIRGLLGDEQVFFYGTCSCPGYTPEWDSSTPGRALDKTLEHIAASESWSVTYAPDPAACRACPIGCNSCQGEAYCECYEHQARHPEYVPVPD